MDQGLMHHIFIDLGVLSGLSCVAVLIKHFAPQNAFGIFLQKVVDFISSNIQH